MICVLHQVLLGDQIEKNGMAWRMARMGDRRSSYRDLVGRPEWKIRVWWGKLKIGNH